MTGVTAAVWSVGIGVLLGTVLSLTVWAVAPGPHSDWLGAGRFGVLAWIYVHFGAAATPAGTVALVPLGVAVIPCVFAFSAMRFAVFGSGTRSLRQARDALVVFVAAYAAAALGMTALLRATDGPSPYLLRTGLGAVAVAACAGGAGAVCGAQRWRDLVRRIPQRVNDQLLAGVASVAILCSGAALLVAVATAASLDDVAARFREVAGGPLDGAILLVLCLTFVPNAVVFAVAYMAGPGFAVGTGTAVGPWSAEVGELPAFPLVGALPGSGPMPVALGLAPLIPVAAGLAVGLLHARRWPLLTPSRAAVDGLAIGGYAGVAICLLAGVAGGPAAGGRLAAFGPSPIRTGLGVAAEVGIGAVVAAAGAAINRQWRSCDDIPDAVVAHVDRGIPVLVEAVVDLRPVVGEQADEQRAQRQPKRREDDSGDRHAAVRCDALAHSAHTDDPEDQAEQSEQRPDPEPRRED